MCLKESEGFTYMGSIYLENIASRACDNLTRIFNWFSVYSSNTSSSSKSFCNSSFASSCSAFSLLISASSVCTSFTSTCNLFPRRQAPPSTRCALELSCEPPSGESLNAGWLQPPCKCGTCMFSFPLAVCAFLAE